MTASPVLSRDADGVRVLTIDRPERLNALDRQTLEALDVAFTAAEDDPQVRVVVLTGAGPKAFVAGADIAQMAALTPIQAHEFSALGQRLMRRIERLPKPVVAMVNGYALGGGLELALACHLRIAAEGTRLGQPEVGLGLMPGFGGTQRLLRLAGRGAALELCLLGAPIDAARALQLGLVQRVVAAADLETATMELAARLAAAAPLALRGILDAVLAGGECPLEEGLAFESARFGLLFASQDMREGTAAFLEKRTPRFGGH
ncbi:enoyl-CoA hydratase [Pseudoxanthomonas broegbernensis]|uniref:Enoyl-CoA hydratase n=1 Tax=Pseudoxanthomonas broegbernensis TaxID=83619 RepID=A0A7V8GMF0_9GAMM|nr:enoyl-CoA hydratase-related protein [Pseudoxanthomonas broegbernensis]KAF1686352.1 enoyl-CoA hydratase [Pseudoxanthomonas broegbernensis]MBB6064046.1 enoyl-CoA hydratase [Pseudoxanthomonas broegbernensis]